MTEYELEREVRDAVGSRLYSGTSEIQYNIAARQPGAVSDDRSFTTCSAPPRERIPTRTAVVDGERSVTYGELDSDCEPPCAPTARHAGSGTATGSASTSTSRSRRVVGIYGVLKAGAAYVPLDPGAPPPRLGYIAATAACAASSRARRRRACGRRCIAEGAPVETLVVLDADDGEVAPPRRGAMSSRRRRSGSSPSDGPPDVAAMRTRTSRTSSTRRAPPARRRASCSPTGTRSPSWTGRPSEFGVTAEDRLSSHAPLHFDLSVFDLFAAATAGRGASCSSPQQLARLPDRARDVDSATQRITVWYSVPSILTHARAARAASHEASCPRLRTVLFAGEVFPTKYLRS